MTCHKSDMDLNHSDIFNRKVSQEMFDSIVREVVEETGVPAVNLVCGNSFCTHTPTLSPF